MFGSIGKKIKGLFSRGKELEETLEDLEDSLLEADLGPRLAMELVEVVEKASKKERVRSMDQVLPLFLDHLRPYARSVDLWPDPQKPELLLFFGVNGVGKTTSIAKIAHKLIHGTHGAEGVVLAAGDTFRAAASEQLQTHGQRLGVRCVAQGQGADPGAVIYDALESLMARGSGVVLADTAGRMHTKKNLMTELEKINRIIAEKMGSQGIVKRILVLDSTTGQNALYQGEHFHEAVGIDGVILTKYDSLAKGGIVLQLERRYQVPVWLVGHGERYEDLSPFEPDRFLEQLFSDHD